MQASGPVIFWGWAGRVGLVENSGSRGSGGSGGSGGGGRRTHSDSRRANKKASQAPDHSSSRPER